MSHVVVIPAPCSFLTANQRHHWAVKAKLTAAWRDRAAWSAQAAKLPAIEGRVHIMATVHRDTRLGRWDVTNWAPTAKAAIDGLVDAGVLVDDSNRYVVGPDMRAGEARPTPALVLTITPDEIGRPA